MSKSGTRATIEENKIDAIFAALDQCHLPGAAVGIAIGGRPVYRKGFGLATLELPVVLTPTTRMRIGSTTKHFTALAWMLLCEDCRATLDDPIGRHLPELPQSARVVTARQLLAHVSGLRDVFDISWHFNGTGRRVCAEDLLAQYTTIDDVNEAPNETWIYNNGGYLLLSIAIERIAGVPLETFMAERIFGPVGMNDTAMRRWDSDFLPNSATLHNRGMHGAFERSYLGTAGVGQGGIVSTVDDMLRWMAHMDAPRVGSLGTWAAIKKPHLLANGTSTAYGLGLRSGNYRGVATVSHSGGVLGGNCQMVKVPAAGLDVIVIVNRSDVYGVTLADKILDACLPDLHTAGESRKAPCRRGVFRSERTHRVVQLLDHDGQQIVSIDGFDVPFSPDADGVLWPTGIQQQKNQAVVFHDISLEPQALELREFGAVDTMVRVPGGAAPVLSTGQYVSRSTGIEISIRDVEGSGQLHSIGPFGSATYDLQPLREHLWRAKRSDALFPPGGVVSFDADGSGLSFSTFRTRSLRFRRQA